MYKVFISGKPAYFPASAGSDSDSGQLYKAPSRLLQKPSKLAKWMENKAPEDGVLFLDENGISSWDEFRVHVREVPAAGGAIRDQHGRVLFIFRRGHWDLPKGKIDPEESISEAGIREVEEECGIDGVSICGRLPMSYHLFERKDRWYLKPTWWFLMEYDGPMDFKPQKEEDIEKVEWMSRSEFDSAHPTFRNVQDIARAAFDWQAE